MTRSTSRSLSLEDALQEAATRHRAGRLNEAEELYRAILAAQPTQPDANHNLGVVALQRGQPQAALPYLKAALDVNPAYGQYWLSYIEALIQSGQASQAREVLAEGLQRGLQGDEADRLAKRLGMLPGSTASDASERQALLDLLAHSRYTEAESLARQVVERAPEQGLAWQVLGVALMKLGRNAEALAAMQQALALSPATAQLHCNVGVILHELGRLDEAEASLRQAICLKPDHVDAHYNLGIVLQELSRYDEAEASFRGALDLKPDHVDVLNNLGIVLKEQGRLEEAEVSLRQALAFRPEYAETQHNLGVVLKELGRAVEAAACLREAIRLRPAYAAAHNALGNILQDLEQLEEAEASFGRAIGLEADYAEAFNNLGNVLQDMGRFEEAEYALRRAIQLKPDFADAYTNLGTVLMEQGRVVEAIVALNRGVELAPGKVVPLATALSYEVCKKGDPRVEKLEMLYAQRGKFSSDERIRLDFAMGKALEEMGEYDRAFDAYAEGNRIHFVRHPHDAAPQQRYLEQALPVFSADLFARYAALSVEGTRGTDGHCVPVFIVGMPRSGTTLIEQVLASHPSVCGAGELMIMGESAAAGMSLCMESQPSVESLASLRELGEEYLRRVRALAPEARWIVDKQPANFLHLGLIHLMLPHARIIHAVRDPLDVCLSCYATLFTKGLEYTYDLDALGQYYAFYRKVMAHWQKVLPPGRILTVSYEEHVAHPEGGARRMLAHLGLDWETACLRFFETRRVVRTASVAQVRQPIYAHSVARWRHFERHLAGLRDIIATAE